MPPAARHASARSATALERAGQWEQAAEAYEERFARAAADQQLTSLVSAAHDAARMRQQQGRLEEAEELAFLSRQIAERCDLTREAARATNTLAVLRHSQQDWAGARELYEAASEAAAHLGDDMLLGWTHQNLGVVANIVGDLHLAKTLYLESIGYTVRSGDRTTAMMAYNNLGIVCADLRDWIEAEVYFSRGGEIAEQVGDVPMLATLQLNRAEPLIHLGELTRARTALANAEELAERIGDVEIRANAARVRAMIARAEGDLRTAEDHVACALRLAGENRLPLEIAEAWEEAGELYRAQRRPEKARDAFEAARAGYAELGAARDAERIGAILTAWGSKPATAS